jgi:hypothetical protein
MVAMSRLTQAMVIESKKRPSEDFPGRAVTNRRRVSLPHNPTSPSANCEPTTFAHSIEITSTNVGSATPSQNERNIVKRSLLLMNSPRDWPQGQATPSFDAVGSFSPTSTVTTQLHLVSPGSSCLDLRHVVEQASSIPDMREDQSLSTTTPLKTSPTRRPSFHPPTGRSRTETPESNVVVKVGCSPRMNSATRHERPLLRLFRIYESFFRLEGRATWLVVAVIAIAGMVTQIGVVTERRYSVSTSSIDPGGCTYVPGAGFSGFWYTLGQLRAIEQQPLRAKKQYVCYSAGCLAVVSTLLSYDMEEMYAIAGHVQQQWRQKNVDHYDVVETFLQKLLYESPNKDSVNTTLVHRRPRASLSDPAVLSRLHIVTAQPRRIFGLQVAVQTPTSAYDLHRMLKQTTWIPGATGDTLFYQGHTDGAFALFQHPRCDSSLKIPWYHWDVCLNTINVNLGRDKVEKFWKAGLAHGT